MADLAISCIKVPGADALYWLYANPHFSQWLVPITALKGIAFPHTRFAHFLLLPSYEPWFLKEELNAMNHHGHLKQFDSGTWAAQVWLVEVFLFVDVLHKQWTWTGEKWPALNACLDSLPVHLFSTSHTEWPENMNYMGTSTWYIVHIVSLNQLPCMSFHRLSVLTTPLD